MAEHIKSFTSDRVYSEAEIRQIVPSAYQWDNGDGQTYIIAQAEREYWFLPEGEGWKVDHTWTSFNMYRG